MTELNSVKAKKIGSVAESLKMLSKNKTIQSGEEGIDGLDQVIWEISVIFQVQVVWMIRKAQPGERHCAQHFIALPEQAS